MPVESLELWTDPTPANWVVDRIHDFAVDVGSVIPDGFDAYARLFHPATRYEAGEEVRVSWSEIAAANGRTVHPEMQWPHISGVWEHSEPASPGLWDEEPEVGTLPLSYAARLSELLVSFTSTPDRIWFCVWEGWGGLKIHPNGRTTLTWGRPRQERRAQRIKPPAPTVQLPSRAYYLLSGPLDGITESMEEPPSWQSANLWWPDDRAWCVATEIDFAWSYIGGSETCVQAVIEDHQFEATPVRIGHGVTYNADYINPPPAGGPY